MSPPKIRLTYFEGRGRAELARLVLAAGRMEFEDVRVSFAEWPKVKPATPYGQLPLLEYDGVKVAQSATIARFLARKAGLAGGNDLEQSQADMVVDSVKEMSNAIIDISEEPNKDRKVEAAQKALDEKLPKFLDDNENILKENGGKFFVGDKLSWADLAMLDFLAGLVDPTDPFYCNLLPELGPKRLSALEKHPLLTALLKRVKEVPEVKKWLQARPKNETEKF